MIKLMKERFCSCYQIDNRIVESDKLAIDSESVDYVFANMYLHHVENPLLAIQEMVRILKSGGKIVITNADEHCH